MVHKNQIYSQHNYHFIIKRIIRYCRRNGNKYSPHNLGEIVDGVIALVENKDLSIKKHNIIKGYDFPTGGELIYTQAIEELYETEGSITIGIITLEEINLGKGKHKKMLII